MQNLSAAREACLAVGLTDEQFYAAIPTFTGTSKRLQKLRDDDQTVVFQDFAHAPSKVKATVDAVAAAYARLEHSGRSGTSHLQQSESAIHNPVWRNHEQCHTASLYITILTPFILRSFLRLTPMMYRTPSGVHRSP